MMIATASFGAEKTETFDKDPKASAGRHFQAWLARVLHLDAQL